MFLFFYGESDFLIKKKIQELEKKYRDTTGGDFSLMKIDGENFNFENLAADVQAVPLLSSSRLVEVFNVLKNKDREIHDKIKSILDKIPPTTVVVFVEDGLPDKRLGLFKALNVKKHAIEFKKPEGLELEKFIEGEVARNGAAIDRQAVGRLRDHAGDDLWRLTSEIEKLANYCEKAINVADVESMVAKNITGNVFELVEAISARDKKRALTVTENILGSGEPVLKTISVINYQFRTIAQIKAAQNKATDNYQIAKICSLSPFQVMKNQRFARSLSWKELARFYGKLVFFDEAIKSGKINDKEGLKELVIVL